METVNLWLAIPGVLIAMGTIAVAVTKLQWNAYMPKVQTMVKDAVTEAMEQEHRYVKREIERLDSRAVSCRAEVLGEILKGDQSAESRVAQMAEDMKYLRGRVDEVFTMLVNRRD